MEITYKLNYNNDGLIVTGGKDFESEVIIPSEQEFEGKYYYVTDIEEGAFARCPNLHSIVIPKSVRWIEPGMFASTALEHIIVSEDNPHYCSFDNVVYTKDMTRLVMAASHGVRYSFTIPETVVTIGEDAFLGCKYLTNVSFPKSLERIDDRAFMYCKRLVEVVLSDSLCILGVRAFDSCTKLRKVRLSSALDTIPEAAFAGCDALESIMIPEGVRVLDKLAFDGCENLEEVVLPESLISIKDFALAECPNMYEIRIPASVKEIGMEAFSCNHWLRHIRVADFSLLEGVELPEDIEILKL